MNLAFTLSHILFWRVFFIFFDKNIETGYYENGIVKKLFLYLSSKSCNKTSCKFCLHASLSQIKLFSQFERIMISIANDTIWTRVQ